MLKKFFVELIGTAVLVAFACGVAVWGGAEPVATSLAFGLVIVAMAYSIGHISGCHINPAVSIAMLVAKKITFKEFLVYIAGQIVGAFIGAAVLLLFFGTEQGFGANAVQDDIKLIWGDGVSLVVAFVAEIVLTFVFVFAILGVTSKKENANVAGLVIGLTLVLVHLIGLAITGTSVNPARSLAPAVFAAIFGDTTSLSQIWIWILAPLAGGVLAALLWKVLNRKKDEQVEEQA